jgi:hypothetical protein
MRSFSGSSKIIIGFTRIFNTMNLLSNMKSTSEKKCASMLDTIYYYLFVWLKLINSINCYIFYFNTHLNKNCRHFFYSRTKYNHIFKLCLFVFIFLFSSSFIQTINATTSSTHVTTTFTVSTSTARLPLLDLDYDLNLFNELNMLETIQNLFRSCFKDSFIEIKEELSKLHNLNTKSTTTENGHFKELLINQILNKLLDRDLTKLSLKFLDLIDSICLSTSNLNQFTKSYNKLSSLSKHEYDKLRDTFDFINKFYLLADYEHYLCGNIFRNSMSSSHLYDHVLKLNANKTKNEIKPAVKLKSKNKSNRDRNNLSISNSISSNQFMNFINMYSFKSQASSSMGAKRLTNFRDINLNRSDKINLNDEFNLNKTYNDYAKMNIFDHDNRQTNYLFSPKYKTKQLSINNCSLILLNVYLLAFKSSCDYESFIESLNHYDCHSNNFSVKSNCDKCQVRHINLFLIFLLFLIILFLIL